jgi:tocopherol O-methyltransferase
MVASREPISAADVARHYDQLDRFYRDIWGEHVHHGYWKTGRETPEEAARAMVDLVIERARIKPGMRVLDVGCGYGATARILAQEWEAKVTGVTVSTMQHRHAESAAAPGENPRYFAEDWLHNRRDSESCDVVIALESTEHMADKARAFSEMARVLKPGGRAVVVAWLAADHRTPWQDAHLIEPVCREGRLAGLGTVSEYQAWIDGAGLTLEEEIDLSSQVSKTWPVCAWRFCLALLRKPGHLRILLDAEQDNRIFALTMLRIWLAYKLGAMRMVVFSASKPPGA